MWAERGGLLEAVRRGRSETLRRAEGGSATWWRCQRQQAWQQWQTQWQLCTPQHGQPAEAALSPEMAPGEGPRQLSLQDAPPGIANLGNSCLLAAALQALGSADAIWEEAAWSEAWAHGVPRELARELWGIIGELRGRGGRGPVRPERLLALLREEVQAFARQGAQDAME